MNLFLLAFGGLSALFGLLTLIAALRGRPGTSRKSTAQLIAGMMLLAFGLVLGGFAIAYAMTEPYDLTQPEPIDQAQALRNSSV